MTNKQLAALMRFHLALFKSGMSDRDSKKMDAVAAASAIITEVEAEEEEGDTAQRAAGDWRLIDVTGNALGVEQGTLVFIDPSKWATEYPLAWPDELTAKRYSVDKNVWGLVKPVFFPKDVTKA